MTVYFIGGDFRYVKIGYTSRKDASGRLHSLQTGNQHKLEILASMPGKIQIEQFLHRRFRHCAMAGEWFSRTLELDSLIQWVREHGTMSGWAFIGNPDALWKPPSEAKEERANGGVVTNWKDLLDGWNWATRRSIPDSAHCEIIDRNLLLGYQYDGYFARRDNADHDTPRSQEVTAISIATGPDSTEWRAALWISIAIRNVTGGPRMRRSFRPMTWDALDTITEELAKIFDPPWNEQMTYPLPVRVDLPRVDSMSASDLAAYAASVRDSLFASFTVKVFRNWKREAQEERSA